MSNLPKDKEDDELETAAPIVEEIDDAKDADDVDSDKEVAEEKSTDYRLSSDEVEEEEEAGPPSKSERESDPDYKINFDYKKPTVEDSKEDAFDQLAKSRPMRQIEDEEEDSVKGKEDEEESPRSQMHSDIPLEKEEDETLPIHNLRPSQHTQMPTSGIYSNTHPEGIARPEHHTFFQDRPTGGNVRPKHKSSFFPFLLLGIISLSMIGGAVYLIKGNFNFSSPTPTPSPEAIVEATPTPSPTPEPVTITRGDYTLKVLNGTTTSGLAATVSAKLTELGYKTEKSTNASNSAFTKTVVRIKADGNQDFLAQLIKDLMPDYSATGEANLPKSTTYDAEVILGGQ